MLREYIEPVTPPILLTFMIFVKKGILGIIKPNQLFNGNDAMFKKHAAALKSYGEYGVGESTNWVHKNTGATITSVDTSKEWIDTVKSQVGVSNRLDMKFVDVGILSSWGRPVDYSKRENFGRYIRAIWNSDSAPELILVDGRFRVACFLYSLLMAKAGTKIIFDDYSNRPHYHVVEEIIKPIEACGRQVLFVVPTTVETDKIKALFEKFEYIID